MIGIPKTKCEQKLQKKYYLFLFILGGTELMAKNHRTIWSPLLGWLDVHKEERSSPRNESPMGPTFYTYKEKFESIWEIFSF